MKPMQTLYTFCISIKQIIGCVIFSDFYEILLIVNKLRLHRRYIDIVKHLKIDYNSSDKILSEKLYDHAIMINSENISIQGNIHPGILGCMISSNSWAYESHLQCKLCDSASKDISYHFVRNHLSENFSHSEKSRLLQESRICFQCLQPLHGLTNNMLHQLCFHNHLHQNCPNCSTILTPAESGFHIRTCRGKFQCFECKAVCTSIHDLLDHFRRHHVQPNVEKWWDETLMNNIYYSFALPNDTFNPMFSNLLENMAKENTVDFTIKSVSTQINNRIKFNLLLKPFKHRPTNQILMDRNTSKFLIYRNLGKFIELTNKDIGPKKSIINPNDFQATIFSPHGFPNSTFTHFRCTVQPALLGAKYLPHHIKSKLPINTDLTGTLVKYKLPVPSKLIICNLSLMNTSSESTILFSPHMALLSIFECLNLRTLGYNVLLLLIITKDTYQAPKYLETLEKMSKLYSLGLIIGNYFYFVIFRVSR